MPGKAFLNSIRTLLNNLLYTKVVDPSAVANEIEERADQLRSGASFTRASQDNLVAEVIDRDFREA